MTEQGRKELNDMVDKWEEREAKVKQGICPDCGQKLKKISAKEYGQGVPEPENGHYVGCTDTATAKELAAGKRVCQFKTFVHEPPKDKAVIKTDIRPPKKTDEEEK